MEIELEKKSLTLRNVKLWQEALEVNGESVQLGVAIEELAELITAISHRLRHRKKSLEEFIEEYADVWICMCGMRIVIWREKQSKKLEEIISKKLDKLEKELARSKKEQPAR